MRVDSTDSSNNEIEALRKEIAFKDSVINDVFLSINVISQNLEAIKLREKIVTTNSSDEISREKKAQINEDISAIDALLEENRSTIQRLQGASERLRGANIRIHEFETLVENLNKLVIDKDADITILKTEMNLLASRLDSLSTELTGSEMITDKIIDEMTRQEIEFNTVHYIVGQEKELIDKGILKKSGFIGRTLLLNDSYDQSLFTQILRGSLDEIVVNRKKAEIVTPHPEDIYELLMPDKNTLESIRITNRDRFWESSKVLVVSYK